MRPLSALLALTGLGLGACSKAAAPASDAPAAAAAPAASGNAGGAAGKPASEPGIPPPPMSLPAPHDVAAPPADAHHEPSGLVWKTIRPPSGSGHPAADDSVEVHYSGWTADGKMFDSSVTRGTAVRFPLNRVIKGWTEGVQLMAPGEKRRFWIPPELAYGVNPPAGAPAGQLVFDVELISYTPAPKPVPPPADVAAVPKDARRSKSGLAWRVLQPGHGKRHPKASDQVEVHYTGWTTDGHMFDSSEQRGQPATFPLNAVIKGWTEGVPLMVEGERRRFWVPAELAYGNQPGRPAGMLVFDIALLAIKDPASTGPHL